MTTNAAPNLRGLAVGKHRLPCPNCDKGKRDTALSLEVRGDGSAVWWCWRCHSSGGLRADKRPRLKHDGNKLDRPTVDIAAAIWKQTAPIAGTEGERYLRLRECALPPATGDLRFHPALYCPEVSAELPALVAKVTTVIGNKAIGIHRIWIRPGEARAVKKMRLGGSIEAVCVRLWPDEDVTYSLGIAEGVETALALARTMKPLWSCVDAGQLYRFPLLPGLESLVIFADCDKPGLSAATAVHDRYTAAGKDARFIYPKRPREDFNDVVMRQARAHAQL